MWEASTQKLHKKIHKKCGEQVQVLNSKTVKNYVENKRYGD